MNLTCKLCGKRVIVADDIVPGQHVRCPFCGGKFSYTTVSKKKKGVTEQAKAKGLPRQKERSPWAEALISSIVIAAVVCCGMFACRTFERFWNDNDGRSQETVPSPMSNGENVNFEFDDNQKTKKMEELGKCLAERKNKANLLSKKVEDSLKLVKADWEQLVDKLDGIVKASLQDNLKKVGNAMQEQCVGLGKLQKDIDRAVNGINDAEAIGNDASSSLAQIEKAIKDVQSCDLGQLENELVRLETSEDYFLGMGMDLLESGFSSDGDENKDAFPIAVETNNATVVSNRMDKGKVQARGGDKQDDKKHVNVRCAVVTQSVGVVSDRVDKRKIQVKASGFREVMAAQLNSRGFAILRKAYENAGDKGVIISPYCIDTAFGPVWSFSGGKTKKVIADVLGFSNAVVRIFREFRDSFATSTCTPFSSVNTMWVDPSVKVGVLDLAEIRDAFDVEIKELDLSAGGKTVKVINDFIDARIRGTICVPLQTIDQGTKLVLANAVCFEPTLRNEFNRSNTRTEWFTLANGNRKKVQMMVAKGDVAYYETRNVQIVFFPCIDSRFKFVVILPAENRQMDDMLQYLERCPLSIFWGQASLETVVVKLPKINMECRTNLRYILSVSGMREPFFPSQAEFPGLICDCEDVICVDHAFHAARLIIGDNIIEGNNLSSESSWLLSLGCTTLSPIAQRNFVVDRPFVAIVYDTQTHLVLAAGVINDP